MTAQSRADRLADRLKDRDAKDEADGHKGGKQGAGQADTPSPPSSPEGKRGAASEGPPPAEEPKDARTKFQAYVLKSVQDEAKAIVYWTNNRPGGYASLTELAEHALRREIERMRHEFTGDQPFPPMPADQKLTTRPPRRGE
ncbi:hypothetical protein [Streptomyces celluloflavus]|uniref:hypothetical protein n=1 Tax=Streptomyces celluloflavus TaxID=58344 RepID=UPI0036B7A06C